MWNFTRIGMCYWNVGIVTSASGLYLASGQFWVQVAKMGFVLITNFKNKCLYFIFMLLHCFPDTDRSPDTYFFKRHIQPISLDNSTNYHNAFWINSQGANLKRKETGWRSKGLKQTRKESVINKKLIFNQVSVILLLFRTAKVFWNNWAATQLKNKA